MSPRLFALALLAGTGVAWSAAAAPAGQTGTRASSSEAITINGVGQRQTLACDNRRVAISGTENAITLTGTCAGLDLMGTDNEVTLTLAPNATVNVSGSDQTVRWRSSGRPRISVQGVDNQVTRID